MQELFNVLVLREKRSLRKTPAKLGYVRRLREDAQIICYRGSNLLHHAFASGPVSGATVFALPEVRSEAEAIPFLRCVAAAIGLICFIRRGDFIADRTDEPAFFRGAAKGTAEMMSHR